ncbi:MAG: PAS domain S-box protein [Chloroflexota bacterium]|nr:PAS domain S-box protein [Chloroflexota bacterium]
MKHPKHLETPNAKNKNLLFSHLVENSKDLIYRYEFVPRRFSYVNPAALSITGYTPEEHYANPDLARDLIHQDTPEGQRALLKWVRKDGSVIWTEQQNVPVYNETGELVAIEGIARDVTEREQILQALRLENQRFLRFFDANIVGIAITDSAGTVLMANDYYLNILGTTRQDFVEGEVNSMNFTPPEWLAADENALQELNDRGICKPYEKEYIRADATRVPVYLVQALLPGPEKQIAAFILDITERQQAEKIVQTIAQDLRRSNEELEQFAYVASHDLQEPLRMVTSYMQLLAERYQGKLDQDADEFIGYAVDGAKRMQNLINDLLAYSRIGTQGNPFVLVSVEELLENALTNLQVVIGENEAEITHDPLPQLHADPVQLSTVIQNLLSNSIKYRSAERPRIHLSARQEGSEWVFSVRDNGIGIHPRFAERIFIIFQRLNAPRKYPGTGIGLAICKRIIQRHGGRIWVESTPGQGATFYFTLPTEAA